MQREEHCIKDHTWWATAPCKTESFWNILMSRTFSSLWCQTLCSAWWRCGIFVQSWLWLSCCTAGSRSSRRSFALQWRHRSSWHSSRRPLSWTDPGLATNSIFSVFCKKKKIQGHHWVTCLARGNCRLWKGKQKNITLGITPGEQMLLVKLIAFEAYWFFDLPGEGKLMTPHWGGYCSLSFLKATPSSWSRSFEGLFELTRHP